MRAMRSAPHCARKIALSMAVAAAISAIGCATQQPIVARDDSAITNEVRARLNADPVANDAKITVATKEGKVFLGGHVATDAVRDSAERIAHETPGVHSVDNSIRFGN